MGLLDELFGSKSKQKQKGTLEQEETATSLVKSTQDQTTDSTKTSEQISEQQQQQITSQQLLSDEETAALSQILLGLSANLGPGGSSLSPEVSGQIGDVSNLASALTDRAGASEGDLLAQVEAIVAEASRTGQNAIEASTTQAAQGAGSNLNSIVQAASAQGEADLATQLAALEANLTLGIRKQSTDELTQAFGASAESLKAGANVELAGQQTGVANLASIAEVLSGAQSQTLTDAISSGQVTTEEQLVELIIQVLDAEETKEATLAQQTTGKVSGGTSGSILAPIGINF